MASSVFSRKYNDHQMGFATVLPTIKFLDSAVFFLACTSTVMADMTCSCFWPNSQNHASQHTDGNTTVFKTHSRLFEKRYICFTMSRMKEHVGNLWLFPLYLCWLLNRSLNHSCIAHTPALATKPTVHFSCLFFG